MREKALGIVAMFDPKNMDKSIARFQSLMVSLDKGWAAYDKAMKGSEGMFGPPRDYTTILGKPNYDTLTSPDRDYSALIGKHSKEKDNHT